ncbi:hypothetical protein E9993_14030 [Labilibacter sediminis]|nr:hypothetical protein E9993_14030 [Labilibacter sediminis]
MNIIKIGIRVSLFALVILLSTVLLEFGIVKIYSLLVEYYSLPKSESDLTILSFVISSIFIAFLTLGSGYWRVSKTV